MLLRKYHIVIFREREGVAHQLKFRGWLIALFLIMLLGFAGSTAYLWPYYRTALFMRNQLTEANKTIEEQNSQVINMAGKLLSLEKDLNRIQQFDSKLRVMMNMDRNPQEAESGEDAQAALRGAQQLPLYRQELLARRVHALMEQMGSDTRMEEVQQQYLIKALRTNREILASTPAIWPAKGYLTSTFGKRSSPFGGGGVSIHKGIDIANVIGTPVWATAKGTVAFAGWDSGYGNSVVLNHANNISTRYAHMSRIEVKVGQQVSRGDKIGAVGNTGRSTGPHLHYEVRIGGVPTDPMRYILN